MAEFDVKLLRVFDEVYKTRSVSRAAHNLGLSQPAISIALAKLRRHFNDPLFVKVSSGMQPTPHASALVERVREAVGLLDFALGHQVVFDPMHSRRAFRVAMTDISQSVLLPALLNHLQHVSRSLEIDVLDISEDTPRMLEAGEADLAIGFMPGLGAGFYQQKLFSQRVVCLCRRDHPRLKGKLTLKQFSSEAHIAIAPSGTGHWGIARTLEHKRLQRRIVLRVPNFLGLGSIVANTDLLATVPRLLAETLARQHAVKFLELPVELRPYQVKQHWHKRFHHDPGNAWLRRKISELFQQ